MVLQQQQQQPHSSQQQPPLQLHPQQQQQQQPKSRPTPSARSRRRLAKVLVALAGVFIACWLPYAAALLYSNWFGLVRQDDDTAAAAGGGTGGRTVHRLVTVAALLLGHAHSAVNPVVYWWLNRHTLQACPWCWSADDEFDDDDGGVVDGTGEGICCCCGAGTFCYLVGGAILALTGCGGGGGGDGYGDTGGMLDCAGGSSHKCSTGCRQSHNHTPTRLNRLLFRQPNNHQRSRQPSSTNEAALGPFNPRFATPKKRPQQSPVVKNPVMLYYA